MGEIKAIGVLTSGGDAPGMNAAIRSVVRTARFKNITVKGILRGFSGLMNNNMIDLTLRSVSGKLQRGGTILYSARCPEFKEDEGVEMAKQNCIDAGLDGLIVCGGDGSFRGARDLSLKGIPCIGIPGTIDNDIPSTEITIGFDTAVNTVVENVDKIRDTSESHNRCSVVEVMGRNCGDIALHAAISCGAECVLLPEVEYDMERDVIENIHNTLNIGKHHFIIIVAEGVVNNHMGKQTFKSCEGMAEYIQARTGIETRSSVIGHVQRGGSPTMRDRVLASMMGNYAVELLVQGKGNRVVGMQQSKMVDYDIYEALKMKKNLDRDLLRIFNEISKI